MMDKVPEKKTVSVYFSCALFSLLGFLVLADGNNRLSQNVGKELSLHTVQYPRRVHISHDDLVMKGVVWLHLVWFRAIHFVVVQFNDSYANLRQPHIFK